jgi:hypothetical protein
MDNQQNQDPQPVGSGGPKDNDGDLDDLLDSALSDFDKKPSIYETKTTSVSQAATSSKQSTLETGKVSIEMTNLYVDDDLDYEDRPKVPLPKPTSTKKASGSQPAVPDFSSLLFGANATGLGASSNPNIDDDMKMFEEVIFLTTSKVYQPIMLI